MDGKSKSQRSVARYYHQYKLFGVFLLIGIAAIAVGAFLVRDIRRAMAEAQEIYARSVRGLDMIGELQYQIQEARQNIVYGLTTTTPEIQADYLAQSREADTQVDRILVEHNALLRDPEEVQASQTFERDWRTYKSVRDEVIRLIQDGNPDQAVRLDINAGFSSFNAVTEDIHRIKQLYDVQAKNRLSDLESVFSVSLIKIGVMLVLILVFAAGGMGYLERGKRLRAVQLSEARLNAVIESINEGMFVVGHDGRIELVNRAAEERWGHDRSVMVGEQLVTILPELRETAIPSTIAESVRSGLALTAHNLTLSVNDTTRIYEARLFPFETGTTVFFNDITERQQADDERLRISKLESIGLLAGGIAHDFNNIMTGVLGYISFAKLDIEPQNPIYNRLSEAEHAAIEAKNLTQQLLTFAKGGAPVKEIVSIPDLLTESVSFVLRGSNVRCEWDIPVDTWPVRADAGQIKQVIHNLVINATQAMPNGGVLTIRNTNLVLGTATQIKGRTLAPGFYIKLTFSDQGVGMTQEQLKNIFDPYFTTKSTGTGLGLTTVYTIITRHEGAITVESTPGEGATFELYLPASSESMNPSQEVPQIDPALPIPQMEGKILIMDDEPIIRDITAHSLTQYGFEVETSANGEEAVELYRQSYEKGAPFHLVIIDLTVPGGMGGQEMIKHLRKINPNVKAIVSSGYHNAPIMSNYKEYGFSGVVPKPYRVQDLFQAVKNVLQRS